LEWSRGLIINTIGTVYAWGDSNVIISAVVDVASVGLLTYVAEVKSPIIN